MVRVGVVGVGSMGQNHARIYSEMGKLVGVYDAFSDTAKKVAKRLGTNAYETVDELLSKVDAVSICTPTSTHFEVAQKAIQQGKSLLVEKPFTGDLDKAKELCELAEANKVTLASGFVERFNPVVKLAQELVSTGRFGKLISIGSRRVSSYPDRIRDVGVIMDLAIHDIDVIRYITGKEVRSVYALGGNKVCTQYEDHANIMLEMSDSTVAMVEVNWLTPMKVRQVSLTCSLGFGLIDYMNQSLTVSTSKPVVVDEADLSQIPFDLCAHQIFVKREEPLRRELEEFIHAAKTSSNAPVDGWDALSNLKVCDGALRSLTDGRQCLSN